jgi:polyisoprenoid-binding protein YceI
MFPLRPKIAALTVVLLTGLGLPGAACAEPQSFRLDPEHMNIAFLAQHLSFAKVLGVFHEAEGTMVFDEEAPALQSLEVRIMTGSVDTRHDARDNHLRSGDFFNARRYPEMVFVLTNAQAAGERTGTMTGDLTIRDQTHPVTLQIEKLDGRSYPFGDRHYAVGVSGRATIKRSEWGMTYGVADGLVGDDIDIIIEAEFIRED